MPEGEPKPRLFSKEAPKVAVRGAAESVGNAWGRGVAAPAREWAGRVETAAAEDRAKIPDARERALQAAEEASSFQGTQAVRERVIKTWFGAKELAAQYPKITAGTKGAVKGVAKTLGTGAAMAGASILGLAWNVLKFTRIPALVKKGYEALTGWTHTEKEKK
jgi:hypothetical protein